MDSYVNLINSLFQSLGPSFPVDQCPVTIHKGIS